MKRLLIVIKELVLRILSAVLALAIVSLGLWIAYLGQYYYISTLRFPYGSIPLWKSVIIVALIVACALAPVYLGYRLVRFAFHSTPSAAGNLVADDTLHRD